MTLPDKELVKKIKRGDQSAFKQLYQRYSDLLFAFISHQLDNDKEAATDIWQEAWIIAVEKIGGFQNRSNFFTWLCAIAKNKISDHYRLTKRQRKFNDEARIHFDLDNEEIETVDDRTRADVITVLALLAEEYRYLLMAKYLENKSTEEISSEIGKTYKATESMLSRARNTFRKKFKQINKR
jgi:RNA polymerase sigma-70 factor, ECF subfamily